MINIHTSDDTIAAIATPAGEGGISVIRISGRKAFEIAGKVFRKDKDPTAEFDLGPLKSHTVHFGYIAKGSELYDEGLLTLFRNPHSYTGEDTVEISCHGGSYLASRILSLIISHGARLAQPGEFTKRAFLNGRIDLSQAEAVSDLIRARTESAHRSSLSQLNGSLSAFVKESREDLLRITSLIELELDFAEEGLEFVSREEIGRMLADLREKVIRIISTYVTGKVIREGAALVIAGKPNSGKSSLFNRLLDRDRAIVSNIPGTTRDYIEENAVIGAVLFRLIDTAGLRESEDKIETEGIQRSYGMIAGADLTLYLIDSELDESDFLDEVDLYRNNFDQERSILVFSKSDLAKKHDERGISVSVFDEASIERLRNNMAMRFSEGKINIGSADLVVTNHRHKQCLENVADAIGNASASLEQGMSGEFVSLDLRSAMSHLGEITGEITNDDILNNIFSKFCIGK